MYEIRRADPKTTTDEELAELCKCSNAVSAEQLPDDPPTSVEDFIKAYRAAPERIRRFAFRAYDEKGAIVGTAGTSIDPEHDENPDLLGVSLVVMREHRRKGIGTRLLAELVQLAEAEHRTRFISNTSSAIEGGAAFAKAVGAEAKSAQHLNHLPIDAIDRAQLEKWVMDGPTRAEGYELIGWDGRCPDEYLDKWVKAILVMNTAPRDDLQVNDFTWSAEQQREQEDINLSLGHEYWVLVAVHKESGEFAGFHDVFWMPPEPDTVYVGATGVWPEHRGHALGKWLKAAMTLRILDERPNVTDIRTGNADSNDAMLGINREMGYRPLLGNTAWELSVERAKEYLAAKAQA